MKINVLSTVPQDFGITATTLWTTYALLVINIVPHVLAQPIRNVHYVQILPMYLGLKRFIIRICIQQLVQQPARMDSSLLILDLISVCHVMHLVNYVRELQQIVQNVPLIISFMFPKTYAHRVVQ